MKKIKKILKNLYKINVWNIIYTILISSVLFILVKLSKLFFQEILDIHIGLNLKIDFLTVYSGFLSLILPVAILIIERIKDKGNAIISESYLKNTRIFPVIVYFVFNLLIFTISEEQYYFIITHIFSTIMIIDMYYKSFKMISDLIYERKKENMVREEIISKDLIEQTRHFSNSNLISNYKKYGIMINKYDYVTTENLEKQNLYPKKEYLIVEQYNYKLLNKIVKKLKEINKEYIASIESESSNNVLKNEKKLNVVIKLLDIGSSTDKSRSWIIVYYNSKYKEEIKSIIRLLDDKVYITSEANNHLYIEMAYEKIQTECVFSINNMSSTLLTKDLNKYLDIYKNYINEISLKIGHYSFEVSYNQVNSLYKFKAYDFLNNIQKNIYDYGDMIVKLGSSKLMNSLTVFLYDMILYSYDKRELLSIQNLYSTYCYLNECSLKLEDESSFNKIKLEIFEFMSILIYNYNRGENDFIHDALLVCNKTLGNIIFNLSLKDKEKCYKYYAKTMKFINDIKDDVVKVNPTYSENNNNYYTVLNDIYKNYICNIFAITSYIIQDLESSHEDISKLLVYYNSFSCNDLTDILINSIQMDYNSEIYSWDLMETKNSFDDDCFYSVNTVNYLIHLYCLLITRKNVNMIKLESSYELGIQVNNIVDELRRMAKEEYIGVFEKVVEDVNKKEKEYIRNTSISNLKVEQFKLKFIENYHKHNKLKLLFKETNNLKIVKRKKKGINYLGIHNIVDKTYFLENTPNNRYIIWSNFEEGYANSFISSEEKKMSFSLKEKAIYNDNSVLSYLNSLSKSKLKKSVLFSNYEAIYNIIDSNNLKYNIKNKMDYSDLFILIKKEPVPVIIIEGLEENFIYHVFSNELGKLEKSVDEFEIIVKDFYNDNKLLKKVMLEKISGSELTGNDKKNYLLESVDLLIGEYIFYDNDKLVSVKFDH